ncbi:MAG TPA: endonuclease/exonuclease/phosphatase family protein [Candidatus Saccharimonadales bacterium]|nr:endonuclease/exonuclease/phosphatase family protein [Candidatus Saccharimonadales bacterium]
MKIASWNVEGRLTLMTKKRRGTPEKILNMIETINADVFILPEAYMGQPATGVNERLQKMGYEWQDARYDERNDEDHPDDIYIRVLSRFKILENKQLRWNDVRGLLAVVIEDPKSGQKIRFIATHLDERTETRRLAQLKDAVSFINSSNMPTVMLGDFNAMHLDQKSQFIQNKVVKGMTFLIPHKRIKGRAGMLIEMATGTSLRFLESETNLRDIDLLHIPTTTPKLREMEWMPSIRMAQIDHIFASPEIQAVGFSVSKDGGSDHRAISANITIKSI